MIVYYIIMLALSFILPFIYVIRWKKHYDVLITLIFLLTPVVNLGYFCVAISTTLEEAIMAYKLTYIGGCYLLVIILFSICSLCGIRLKNWMKALMLSLSTIVYLFTITIGKNDLFYKSVEFGIVNGVGALQNKVYGPTHDLFYGLVMSYFILSIAAIFYSYFKNKQTSRKTILLLMIAEALGVIFFFSSRFVTPSFQIVPLAYIADLVIFLLIVHRIMMYDVTDTAISSIVTEGEIGFISFDKKLNYLGSNDQAKVLIPELSELTVDKKIDNERLNMTIGSWLNEFIANEDNDKFYTEKDDKTYLVTISYIYEGKKKTGFHIEIKDDSQNQEYIKLLNSFNYKLQLEVHEKTDHIVQMNNDFILGIATIVESRDNSTGDHIKRTSEGVRILVNEMLNDGFSEVDDKFAKNLIKAAPMHDLGKIAVDDAILRKPGRFNDEDYKAMRKHAAEGARIIKEIVDDTDPYFKGIAENVAHYHHEWVDGSGYPDNLKGDDIPLEARIMAIADVYDALVSKRVYKEKYSFEKAYEIIMSEMGSHFDKKLEKYFLLAKPKLESYYSTFE